jgi:NADPH-dependent curcumin reductase CurA
MNHVLRDLSRPDHSHASGGEAHSRYNRQWWYVQRPLRMRGVLLMNYLDRRGEAEATLWRWKAEGRLKPIYSIVDGLENAPNAMIGLMAGANRGVSMVRI